MCVLFQRPSLPSSSGSSNRYYFEELQLSSTQVKISVSTASRLPEDLQSLKSSLGLILFNLEDATVELGATSPPLCFLEEMFDRQGIAAQLCRA